MMFSACIAVLSVVIAVQTFSAISKLYQVAEPPHFLQMHKGEIDQSKIDDFMSNQIDVTYWQTVTLINIHGENLTIVSDGEPYDLSKCRLDISLVKQNESKDLLLNSNHEKVTVEEGEMGIPALLHDMYGIDVGDRVVLLIDDVKKAFIVKEIVLDAQMNSSLVSSTRILISDEEFDELLGNVGEIEYIIEGYFTDAKLATGFQTDYENAGLPQYGQAVTYSMIFLLSAFTDISTVFIMLIVSTLLVLVSFICIRFTLMAALEEDIAEIGTMKAIGFPFTDIRAIYLLKYRVLAAGGVIVGYILAMSTSRFFTKHIQSTFGSVKLSTLAIVLSLLGGLTVFFMINGYCKKILKRIKKLSIVDALVRGKGFDKDKGRVKDGLCKSKKLPVNSSLALWEVLFKFRNWAFVTIVVTIVVAMLLVPINLVNTFETPEFVTYMGASLEDIMIEVENGEGLNKNYVNTKIVLNSDDDIKEYFEYRRVRVQTLNADNERMNMHIDCGHNAGEGLQYLKGKAPLKDNEIAITFLYSEEIGKDVGDCIVIFNENMEREFIISGIYQDVTTGGYTAKSKYQFNEIPAEHYSFTVNVNAGVDIDKKADELANILCPGVNVDPTGELINQTLGGVINQLKNVVLVIVAIGACLIMLITLLFLKLRLAKDKPEIATMKAIGFTYRDVMNQYFNKIVLTAVLGIIIGTLLTELLGETVVNTALILAGLGIRKIQFFINPLVAYIFCPLGLLLSIGIVTGYVLRNIKGYNIMSIINE